MTALDLVLSVCLFGLAAPCAANAWHAWKERGIEPTEWIAYSAIAGVFMGLGGALWL